MSELHDGTIVLKGGSVIDGNGKEAISNASVVIQKNTIVHVGKAGSFGKYSHAKTIDVSGKTIMPGMVECHFHMYADPEIEPDLVVGDIARPAQWVVMGAQRACQIALRCGYTSVVGAGTLHNIDFWVNQAIEKGIFLGPRIMPASREITSTGGYVDWSPYWWKLSRDGLAVVADGPQETLKAARQVLKEGAEIVKIYPSGDGYLIGKYTNYFTDCRREREVMTFEEIDALTQETHRWNRLVMAHCRNIPSVKNCLRAGVDIINHATWLDDECWRLFKERPPLAVCPALGFIWFLTKQNWGKPEYYKEADYESEYKRGCENMPRLHKMGIKIVPGGDYGFEGVPHGLYAKDLELFVKDCGFSPLETLTMATKNGSYLMRMQDQIGTLEVGKRADLLVIDGDPLDDITLLQDKRNILIVMKDGKVHASQGKVLSPDWDMLSDENFETLQRIAEGKQKVPALKYESKPLNVAELGSFADKF